MITVADFYRRKNDEGLTYFGLVLEGDPMFVQSKNTGRFYATAKRAYMFTTFSEETCKKLVGKDFPGKIVKVDCDPYEYEIPESGETIELNYTYQYQPEVSLEEETILDDEVVG